jgi:DNA-binding NarL/FixJ family response regulator
MTMAGREADRCEVCSAVLEDTVAEPAAGPLDNVIVVEDTTLLREVIGDILKHRQMAKNVVSCINGSNFISTFTTLLLKKQKVGLVILDVNMPIMNGANAAIAMRAVEHAFEADKPTPVLFFTVKQCDEQFRKLLKYCSPAMYINKGQAASPAEMQERVEKVVAQLLRERENSLW